MAWSAHIAEDFRKSIEIGRILEDDKDIFACPGVKEIVAEKRRGRCPDVITPKWASEACYVGWLAGKNPAILWGCASDKIAEAERLMK